MSKPEPEKKKQPTCLKCGKEFNSMGPFNRICPPCDRINAREYIPRIRGSLVYSDGGSVPMED